MKDFIFNISNDVIEETDEPSITPDTEDTASSKKIDLVVLEPDQDEFEDDDAYFCYEYLLYAADKNEYFGNGNFAESFDTPEFPENLSPVDADIAYRWFAQNHCEYIQEGLIGFQAGYNITSKIPAINLLKQCPYIGTIYEIDSNNNIIATY